ncbi:hypothetical protein GSI_04834 [Ganoderma sinense ZZ0214-1]|uniref:Uncharacterized protein n=1 Tax=Ganoderma sinense ZZ0214-1 TaxID=1077348 RepID=A0A2G8SG30_9APHY|nr:hypothetical protein GSI_04834 [Ganoderma sinense ZZ0214-1]
MLQKFAGLRELSLDDDKYGFNVAMLRQLSAMTSLNALTVTITNLDPSCLQPLRDNFPLLRRLKLKGHLDHLVKLILACCLPLLHALTLEVKDRETPENLAPRLTPLSQHSDLAKSLTHIRLHLFSGTVARRVQNLAHYLEPLLSFSKLEHCDLDFSTAAPSICDNDLIRLGDAWPNLQHLNVRGQAKVYDENTYGWYHRHHSAHAAAHGNTPDILHPTVLGLTELARRCPTLRYVHLVTLNADARQGTLPQRGAASRAQAVPAHPSLRELLFECVGNASTAARRCALVERLDAAFPGLDVSRSKAECAYPNLRPEWRRIMLLLRALRYRRDPKNLGPNAHRRAAAAAKFAASRKSLAGVDKALSDAEDGDSDREWDFDSDEDDDDEDEDGGSYLSGSESSREDWESDH